jgi:predicted DNA binding CopG/RHH family protein
MKTKRIDIRLTNYEVQQLEAEAIRRGMNKSELIRSLIAQFPAPPKAG